MQAVDRCVAGRPAEALRVLDHALTRCLWRHCAACCASLRSSGRLLSAARQGTRALAPPRSSCPRCAAGRPADSEQQKEADRTSFVCLTRAPAPPRPSCPRSGCAAGHAAGSDAPRALPVVQVLVICRVSTRKQLTEFTQFVCSSLTPRRVLSSTSGLLRTQH